MFPTNNPQKITEIQSSDPQYSPVMTFYPVFCLSAFYLSFVFIKGQMTRWVLIFRPSTWEVDRMDTDLPVSMATEVMMS